jgi:hypothetical protein
MPQSNQQAGPLSLAELLEPSTARQRKQTQPLYGQAMNSEAARDRSRRLDQKIRDGENFIRKTRLDE